MDNGVPVENSSSRSDNPLTILGIRERGTGGSQCRVSLSDGSSFFCSTLLVSSFGFREGLILDKDLYEKFLARLERERARRKALELLARREHSREELKNKLLSRSFPPSIVREVLDDLTESGYLNTHRFAEEWVRTRLQRHPEGRMPLYAGLISHGVPRPEAETVLADMLSGEVVEETALAAARKFLRGHGIDDPKLKKRLFSLGFDRKTTMKVIERLKEIS